MALDTAPEKARFRVLSGPSKNTEIAVQFNPAALEYTVANTLKNKGRGSKKKQIVNQSSAKLAMELVFDTTDTGHDVLEATSQFARFMEPKGKAPSKVLFKWGAYRFQGMVETYKETIDFFAASGVPLRSTVKLTLSRQDKVFEKGSHTSARFDESLKPGAVAAPPPGAGPGKPRQGGASGTAVQAGAPGAARAIGELNGEISLRFSNAEALTVDQSFALGAPAVFASGGSAVAGLSADASASFGASAAAGVSASGGAFAGLRAGAGAGASASASLDVESLLPKVDTGALSLGAGADVNLSGQASARGSASLQADVGVDVSLSSRITFDTD